MEQEERAEPAVRGRRGRIGVALGIGGGLALVAVAAGWIEREPIVEHFAARALAARHVSARYRITALGPFAQRLEDVTIGDPADPDLAARVVELRLGYGLDGPYLVAVRARGMRLKARVVDGKLSLGAIDRLLPATSSTAPIALPDMTVMLADTRVTLATPAGRIVASVAGSGNLSDGFHGTLTAASQGLRVAGCTIAQPDATLDIRIAGRRPAVRGPIDLVSLSCASGVKTGAGSAGLDLAFASSLDRWKGDVTLAGFAGEASGARFAGLSGRIGIAGTARRMEGGVQLASGGIATAAGGARRASVSGLYRYAAASTGLVFAGQIDLAHAALTEQRRKRLTDAVQGLSGTPVGPLAARLGSAVDTLLKDADAHAMVAFAAGGPGGLSARVRRLDLTGDTGGGHVTLGGGNGVGWTRAGLRVDGRLTMGNGGLPLIDASLAQADVGRPIVGVARVQAYEARGAKLAMTPVRFSVADDGTTRFDTVATLDGPIGNGRIEGLTIPLAGRIDGRGGFVLGEGCVPIGFRTLRLSGIALDPATLRACGINGAPIVSSRGAGLTLADSRISGRSGASPLTIAAGAMRLAASGIAVEGLAVTLGVPDARTKLDVAAVAGAATKAGFAGTFTDAGGQIGHVPLSFSGAAGNWRFAGGMLDLVGAMVVADAAPTPRFLPLAARDVALRLADDRIVASGALHEPKSDALVSDVTITHDLSTGRGGAVLDVPALVFADKKLQPEALTPLTLGVIANVAGTVSGRGHIDWTAQSVASDGAFTTDGIDLAAAFGPVRKIVGTIHFSDLLGLVTPPHQQATIAEVNPGIAVDDGVVHYQLVGGTRIQVEDARWPFAGGTLSLEPSLLAFDEASQRHLTFRVDALDAAAFVQQLAFPNISATGTFDGVLPMIFDQTGGRIEKGLLAARKDGGTLAYVGDLTTAQLGQMGKLAFDALKAIRYTSLSIALDGRLDGEIVSLVKFEGIRQATGDAGYVARLIYNLPFRFNIAIRAPFRGLLGSARAYADPDLLLTTAMHPTPTSAAVQPAAVQPAAIQPAESETVR